MKVLWGFLGLVLMVIGFGAGYATAKLPFWAGQDVHFKAETPISMVRTEDGKCYVVQRHELSGAAPCVVTWTGEADSGR